MVVNFIPQPNLSQTRLLFLLFSLLGPLVIADIFVVVSVFVMVLYFGGIWCSCCCCFYVCVCCFIPLVLLFFNGVVVGVTDGYWLCGLVFVGTMSVLLRLDLR